MSRTMRSAVRAAFVVALVAASVPTLLVLVLAPAAAGPPSYEPPTSAPVVDPFRPPAGPYGAGNRGLEYATVPGEPARAVADGVVAFAGQVAGRLVVSVDHTDGLRSSLTGLATIVVATGGAVRRGAMVGTVADRLHLGIRRGDTHLDPAALFVLSAPTGAVHLVPADGPLGGSADASAERGSSGGSDGPWRGRRVLSPTACPPACKPGDRLRPA